MKKAALLLTPGASATRDHRALVALDEAMPKAITVERIDLPRTNKQDRVVGIINEAAGTLNSKRLFLGGRSFGGRMCSLAVAQGLPARGLVLISYPLHPPGKPDQLRVEHFKDIQVPCLFVSGTSDAFATPHELRKHTRKIKGDVTLHFVDGDHGMKKGEAEMVETVKAWIIHQIAAGA